MTPSEQAKSYGLESLAEVSRATGQSVNTLINWHKSKPDLFHVVLLGCLRLQENDLMFKDGGALLTVDAFRDFQKLFKQHCEKSPG